MRKFQKWEIGRCVARLRYSKRPGFVSWLPPGFSLPSDTIRAFRVVEGC